MYIYVSPTLVSYKQNKTKQNKTKQNKTKQNKIQIYLFCLTSYKGRLGDFKSSS